MSLTSVPVHVDCAPASENGRLIATIRAQSPFSRTVPVTELTIALTEEEAEKSRNKPYVKLECHVCEQPLAGAEIVTLIPVQEPKENPPRDLGTKTKGQVANRTGNMRARKR